MLWWTDYVFISVRFMSYFYIYCFSKIQNKKAKVNSREYLLLKEDVFMRVGVALFFPLGKKLPQIVIYLVKKMFIATKQDIFDR